MTAILYVPAVGMRAENQCLWIKEGSHRFKEIVYPKVKIL